MNITGVNDLKSDGVRQVRPSLTIVTTNPLPGGDANALEVQVQTRAAVVDVVDKDGKVVSTTDDGPALYRLALGWVGGWVGGHRTVLDLALDQ